MTLETLFQMAVKRLGSADAVLAELEVSRQRLQNARRGGPPLRAERLVKLGLIAGVEPLTALRAGGRAELADLLEQAGHVNQREVTPEQRSLLHAVEQLSQKHQALLLVVARELLPDDRPAGPPASQRRRSAKR